MVVCIDRTMLTLKVSFTNKRLILFCLKLLLYNNKVRKITDGTRKRLRSHVAFAPLQVSILPCLRPKAMLAVIRPVHTLDVPTAAFRLIIYLSPDSQWLGLSCCPWVITLSSLPLSSHWVPLHAPIWSTQPWNHVLVLRAVRFGPYCCPSWSRHAPLSSLGRHERKAFLGFCSRKVGMPRSASYRHHH